MPYNLTPEDDSSLLCLECGHPIGYGRLNRKFCCDKCKNQYNNRRRYPGRDNGVMRVMRILENNRDILLRLDRMGVHMIDRTTLLQLGFNLEYSTSVQPVSRYRWRYSCFDYSYEVTPSRVKNIEKILPSVVAE